MAHVIAVCKSDRRTDPKTDIGEGILRVGYGLEGDSHAGLSKREVALLDVAHIHEVNREHDIKAIPGSFAENLTIAGAELSSLRIGDVLQVGVTKLEVVQLGKPLSATHTYNFQGVSILPLYGVFCRVLEGGPVQRGDPVTLPERAQ